MVNLKLYYKRKDSKYFQIFGKGLIILLIISSIYYIIKGSYWVSLLDAGFGVIILLTLIRARKYKDKIEEQVVKDIIKYEEIK